MLFRSETIEELEASSTDCYPFPWLEETLRDESVPWEDRYWLDCRVRAAIAQNTHTFYDTENNPVHIDANGVFPGEFYWREHMVVDPAGWNAPEGLQRPSSLDSWDIGHLYNLFGYRPQFTYHFDLFAYIGDKQIWSDTVDIQGSTFPFQIDVSPGGHYLIINPPQAAHGAPSEFGGSPGAYNLPFVALRVEGR